MFSQFEPTAIFSSLLEAKTISLYNVWKAFILR